MRSKIHIKGHPLHPILVSFPIAFFIGTFLLDLILLFTREQSYGLAAVYMEAGGLVFAILAAVPGVVDYYHTVPPGSSAKKRATQHGLLNSIAVLVFSMAFLLRLKNDITLVPLLIIEGIGVCLLSVAGWLGGTLVTRNQISVDHRYAGAGKWQEETITTTANTVELKNVDTLKVNQMKLLRINNRRIVVARTESGLVAFDDRCTHRGGSLADGVLICGIVQCPWHGSQFTTKDGAVKAGPATEKIKTYQIKSEGNTLVLQL